MSRSYSLVLAGLLAAAPAAAQTGSPAPLQPPTSQDVSQRAHRFVDRFNAANTSHDGRLTLPQAQVANMPWVARNFAAIDTQQKGYITMQDVLTYRQQIRGRIGAMHLHRRMFPIKHIDSLTASTRRIPATTDA
jgi:hypothetical protein